MKTEFTKKQQTRIDQSQGIIKDTWIEHFRANNILKQSPKYKLFVKQEKEKDKNRY